MDSKEEVIHNSNLFMKRHLQLLKILLVYHSKIIEYCNDFFKKYSKTRIQLEQLPDGFGSFPYTSGLMEDRRKDIIKCNLDSGLPERTRFQGRGGIFGEQLSEVSPVDYNDLETIIPGFSFLSAPCNVCDNKCQFKLNVKPTKLF